MRNEILKPGSARLQVSGVTYQGRGAGLLHTIPPVMSVGSALSVILAL